MLAVGYADQVKVTVVDWQVNPDGRWRCLLQRSGDDGIPINLEDPQNQPLLLKLRKSLEME